MSSTGADSPKPLSPSRTIGPPATASSTRRVPQSRGLPPRSTPWSSDHVLCAYTRESGRSGNTQPLVPAAYRLAGAGGGDGVTSVPPLRQAEVRSGVVPDCSDGACADSVAAVPPVDAEPGGGSIAPCTVANAASDTASASSRARAGLPRRTSGPTFVGRRG